MKIITLAMLLAVMQGTPQAPRKEADTSPNAPTNDHITVIIQQPSFVSGWEKAYVVLTGLLVLVGAVGIGYAVKTLNAVERQAKANENQLTEIQQSAEKTDRMIVIAAQEAENGKVATEAAKKSADAALKQATALVNSERPWMIIELTPIPGVPKQGYVSFHAWNRGRTPAEITDYRGDFFFHGIDEEFPAEPTFKPFEMIYRQYVSPGNSIFIYGFDLGSSLPPDQWEWMAKERKYLYFKGRIIYRDMITYEQHESRFCYWVSPALGVGLIMGGDRDWNKYT